MSAPRDALAKAEIAAREAQDALPPPYVPPAVPALAEPAVYSALWFDNLITINEANLRQQQGNVAALRQQLAEAEKALERITGALDALRALKQMGLPGAPQP